MLVLTSRKDEGVRVYDNDGRYMGRIVNLGVERDRVKLGFDVDARFTLVRDELLEEGNNALGGQPHQGPVVAEGVSNNGKVSAEAE